MTVQFAPLQLFDGPIKIEDKILAVRQGTIVAEADFVVHVIAPESVSVSPTTPSTTTGVTTDTEVPFITGTWITTPDTESSMGTRPSPSSTTVENTSRNKYFHQYRHIRKHSDGVDECRDSCYRKSLRRRSHPQVLAPPLVTVTIQSTHPHYTTVTTETIPPTQPSTGSAAFSFSRPMYFAFVPEGQYSNGIRLSVKPEAFSVNRNTTVRYEIDDSAGRVPFFVTTDGQLIIFDVDRETRSSYMFPIKATSPEFGTATAMVNVTILDVNDNYPMFDSAPSAIGVFSDVAVGTPLLHLSAQDRDADNYGTVVYGIEEPDTPFEIDPNGEYLRLKR
ncbi:hypothetical protein OSTOST_10234 [Ostertagia ostertagi]